MKTRRNFLYFLFFLSSFIFACGQTEIERENAQLKREINQLLVENDSLKTVLLGTQETKKKEVNKIQSKKKTKISFERKNQSLGIVIGTPADDVLAIRGRSSYPTKIIGEDSNGLIVEWKYPDGVYVMRRSTVNGITCYRVAKMK